MFGCPRSLAFGDLGMMKLSCRWPTHRPQRITMSHEKLCLVHRSLIAMSGRAYGHNPQQQLVHLHKFNGLARSVRARLVGQGFNPDCRKRYKKCRALAPADCFSWASLKRREAGVPPPKKPPPPVLKNQPPGRGRVKTLPKKKFRGPPSPPLFFF